MRLKIGFIFPGQGSQTPGMGLDIYEKYPEVRNIFDKADEMFGKKLSDICFNGSKEDLKATDVAQPALLTVSYSIYKILQNNGLRPSYMGGHSLGEYTSLVCGGVLSFEDAFKLVKIRGELMAEIGKDFPGTMIAVLGIDKNKLEKLCSNFSDENENEVVIANYNAPNQMVVSGEINAVKKFSRQLEEKNIKNITLNVSGAFHSPLMKPALEKLIEAIENTSFYDSQIPIITNIDGEVTIEGRKFKEKLKWHFISPVLWEEIINCMIARRVNTFVEVGPKKILTKMIEKIDSNQISFSVNDCKTLQNFLDFNRGPF